MSNDYQLKIKFDRIINKYIDNKAFMNDIRLTINNYTCMIKQKNTLTKRSLLMSLIKNWTTELRYKPYEQWSVDYVKELKNLVASSNWRLNYHIQPQTGLLNDPNGFSYFNEKWHLFYQAYPMGPVHGVKSWFHLTSDNLIDWQKEGLALLPDSIYDSHGVYSGSAFAVKDQLFLAYTGNVRDQNWERSSYQIGAWMDQNNHIVKEEKPFISAPPAGYTHHFRDPQVFYYNDQYYLVIGAQNDALEGKVLTYTSKDLNNWQLLGELSFTEEQMGFMVECPNLVFVEDKVVLLFCPQGLDKEILSYQNIYPNTYVIADSFDTETNTLSSPSALENLDEGFDVYATQAFNAPDGRTLAVSWIGLPEISYPSDEQGWAHCLSLVKELSIQDGKLLQLPAAETKELRKNKKTLSGRLANHQNLISTTENSYELQLNFESGAKGTLSLLADSKTNSALTLSFDTEHGTMTINRENNGTDFGKEFGYKRSFSIPQSSLSLQIFVDRSVVEIFVNKGQKVVTARVFPNNEQTGIALEGENSLFSGNIWTLRPMK